MKQNASILKDWSSFVQKEEIDFYSVLRSLGREKVTWFCTEISRFKTLTGWQVWRCTIIFIIFWDFLTFYQIFFSPQVKICAISTYKHDIHGWTIGLPNNLRLHDLTTERLNDPSIFAAGRARAPTHTHTKRPRTPVKQEISGKSENPIE